MAGKPELKVVLHQRFLQGSLSSEDLQRVATAYVGGLEYRVWAPAKAKGDAAEWIQCFAVRQLVGFNSEEDIEGELRTQVLEALATEFQRQGESPFTVIGTHPDGIHTQAQICRRGHTQHCDGFPFKSTAHCAKCGSSCIDACSRCGEPIRGVGIYESTSDFERPNYCRGCGRPYPWMDDLLATARELLYHDDKLTLEDRDQLWECLKYVMSDPKADLVPAKRKLIDIKLGQAGDLVRELITDIVAKVIVAKTE